MTVPSCGNTVLVANQNQANTDSPDAEGHEGEKALSKGELGVVHLWETVSSANVQVNSTTESQDEANEGIVNRRGCNDECPKQDAKAAEEVEGQGLQGGQFGHGASQNDKVRDLLRKLMQDGAGSHTPAKGVPATLEGCPNEEAVAEIVEEVPDDHGSQQASLGPEFLCLVHALQLGRLLPI